MAAASAAIRQASVAGALACLAGSSLAQQAPAVSGTPLPAELVKYQVEFIVFAHTDADANEELFAAEAADAAASALPFGAPAPIESVRTDVRSGNSALESDELKPIIPIGVEPTPDAPFWFRVLRPDELVLASTLARLERMRAYHVLASGGWIQEGLDETAAQPMSLANLGIVNPSGSLRLNVSRYLHLSVDLEFRAEPLAGSSAPAQDALALNELLPGGTKYRMVEQRRARSGELHYVDHPMFGLLFLISPAPEEAAPVEDDTAVLAPAI